MSKNEFINSIIVYNGFINYNSYSIIFKYQNKKNNNFNNFNMKFYFTVTDAINITVDKFGIKRREELLKLYRSYSTDKFVEKIYKNNNRQKNKKTFEIENKVLDSVGSRYKDLIEKKIIKNSKINDIIIEPEKNDIIIEPEKNDIIIEPEKNDIIIEPERNDIIIEPEKNDIIIEPEKNDIIIEPESESDSESDSEILNNIESKLSSEERKILHRYSNKKEGVETENNSVQYLKDYFKNLGYEYVPGNDKAYKKEIMENVMINGKMDGYLYKQGKVVGIVEIKKRINNIFPPHLLRRYKRDITQLVLYEKILDIGECDLFLVQIHSGKSDIWEIDRKTIDSAFIHFIGELNKFINETDDITNSEIDE